MPQLLQRVLIRTVPIGFVAGALMELFMVKVQIGDASFYETAVRLEAERRATREEELDAARSRLRESRQNSDDHSVRNH